MKNLWQIITIITMSGILAGITVSCSSGTSWEISESDKLTQSETRMIIAHARIFVRKQAVKLKLTPEESATIEESEPKIRTHYTGYKQGKLSLEWVFPKKQFFAVANGDLRNTRDWYVSISKKADVIYYNKNASPQQKSDQIDPKEFDSLLK